jgi:hypothetical protein
MPRAQMKATKAQTKVAVRKRPWAPYRERLPFLASRGYPVKGEDGVDGGAEAEAQRFSSHRRDRPTGCSRVRMGNRSKSF